jgi:hypothetical protein
LKARRVFAKISKILRAGRVNNLPRFVYPLVNIAPAFAWPARKSP